MGFSLPVSAVFTWAARAPLGPRACWLLCLAPLLGCGAGLADNPSGAIGDDARGGAGAVPTGSFNGTPGGNHEFALPTRDQLLSKLESIAPQRSTASLFEPQSRAGLRELELLAIHARSGGAQAELDLGIFYANQERSLRALAHLLESARLQPDAGELWFWLGVTCALLELPVETLACLGQAEGLGWWSPSLERVRAEAWTDVGDDERALAAFEACLAEDPKDWRSLLGCSRLLELKGDLEPALDLLARMTQLDPEHPTPHYRSAAILRRLGRMDEARKAERLHRRCAILDDLRLRGPVANPMRKRLAVGAELLAQGRPEEALLEYEDCLALPIESAAMEAARLGKARCLSMLEQERSGSVELAGWRPALVGR